MATRVVDASVWAAFLFGEPRHEEAKSRCEGHTLYAPTLLPYEVQNVAVTKIRKHPEQKDAILKSLSMGMDYDRLTLVGLEDSPVASLALETDLTAYDASYLLLCNRLNCQLVTFDQTLRQAADTN
ncbi:MAG: type II toxin-antitoxin system VapC family toxin [bacterium]